MVRYNLNKILLQSGYATVDEYESLKKIEKCVEMS